MYKECDSGNNLIGNFFTCSVMTDAIKQYFIVNLSAASIIATVITIMTDPVVPLLSLLL